MKKLLFISIFICNMFLHAGTNILHQNIDNPVALETILNEYAAEGHHDKILKLMSEYDDTKDGDTPFHLAIRNRQQQSCIILSRYLASYLRETIRNRGSNLTLKELALRMRFGEIFYLFEKPLSTDNLMLRFPQTPSQVASRQHSKAATPSTSQGESPSDEEPLYAEVLSAKKSSAAQFFETLRKKFKRPNSSEKKAPPLPQRTPLNSRSRSLPEILVRPQNNAEQDRTQSVPNQHFQPIVTREGHDARETYPTNQPSSKQFKKRPQSVPTILEADEELKELTQRILSAPPVPRQFEFAKIDDSHNNSSEENVSDQGHIYDDPKQFKSLMKNKEKEPEHNYYNAEILFPELRPEAPSTSEAAEAARYNHNSSQFGFDAAYGGDDDDNNNNYFDAAYGGDDDNNEKYDHNSSQFGFRDDNEEDDYML